jgi:hypothetical protein
VVVDVDAKVIRYLDSLRDETEARRALSYCGAIFE